ncbi:MAG: asparagine synthase (glutamine-hydrolyzing) [Deltaproteobacteria bacterium]|nr:asparagine synthase (glutamine-hydrolyzing) [Deltaproteobacteria bacterium]
MCGICGVLHFDSKRPVEKEILAAMTDVLRHRGPDSCGFYTSLGIGLGIQRLSIIDLQTGDQPIFNEDRKIAIVSNGEIYNYKELRESLIQKGHRFNTSSDVEVIVHLYEEYGVECLGYLRGMFGFALWDSRSRQLMMARDRLGIKPLHYAVTKDGLYFASEQKSILASNQIQRQIDMNALTDIFSLGYVRAEKTMFSEIRRLLPGHYLLCSNGSVSMQSYWDLNSFFENEDEQKMTSDQWAEALNAKIKESVRIHLRSDVGVGAWLSPGIDSSTIVSMVSEQLDFPVKTFSLGFENKNADEIGKNKTLDQFKGYNIESKRIFFTEDHFNLLPDTIWYFEDPCLASVGLCGQVLSRETAKHVKVVLTGEGSDELFGGYPWYINDKVLRMASKAPLPLKQIINFSTYIQRKWPRGSFLFLTPMEMNLTRFRRFTGRIRVADTMGNLFSDHIAQEISDFRLWEMDEELPLGFENWHYFQQMQYYDMKVRLPDYINHNLDRASMSYSLEARVPFLDHELVEFCLRIPSHIKLKRFQEKYILRKAMKKNLPAEIVKRKKRGLMSPFKDWLRGNIPDFAEEMLSESSLRKKGYFNPSFVFDILKRFREGDPFWGSALIGVLNVQLWDETFMKGADSRMIV